MPSPALIDRFLHAKAAQLTGGLSPAALAGALMDWLVHLTYSPGKQIELAERVAVRWRRKRDDDRRPILPRRPRRLVIFAGCPSYCGGNGASRRRLRLRLWLPTNRRKPAPRDRGQCRAVLERNRRPLCRRIPPAGHRRLLPQDGPHPRRRRSDRMERRRSLAATLEQSAVVLTRHCERRETLCVSLGIVPRSSANRKRRLRLHGLPRRFAPRNDDSCSRSELRRRALLTNTVVTACLAITIVTTC